MMYKTVEIMILWTCTGKQKVFFKKNFDKNAEMSEFGYLSDGQ